MGKSKWVKLNPWYYTTKRQASRQAAKRAAIEARPQPRLPDPGQCERWW